MHRLARTLPILSLCLLLPSNAAGIQALTGLANTEGPADKPAAYLHAMGHLDVIREGFENRPIGSAVGGTQIGGVVLYASPLSAMLIVGEEKVAGARPTEGVKGILVAADSTTTTLKISPVSPANVRSVGFALLGLTSPAECTVYGQDRTVLAAFTVPRGQSAERRWVAIFDAEQDVFSVSVKPRSAGSYGLDEVEIGVHTPEPASILLMPLALALWFRRR